MPKRIHRHKKPFRRRLSAWLGIRHTTKNMPKRIHHHKKSFRRRVSAWLGIRHTTKKYTLLYFLVLIILIISIPFFMKFLANFKEHYGKGYGYVPRDDERSERLREAMKPIPFQPKGVWQYGKSVEERK